MLFTLFLLALDLSDAQDLPCIGLHCPLQMGRCVLDPTCYATLNCMAGCSGKPDEAQCQFECEMTIGNGNAAFIELLQCMAKHGCLPELPEDGACLAGEADTVQTITELEMVAGDWWVVRGVNCGQDNLWSGGYDWYPCQHERYLQLEDDTWINNTTYCGGTDSACSTDQIVTIPHATIPSPGLIRLDYDDEPLLPQVEKWHIVSRPQEDFMFVMWCGTNPALDYNGAFVLSRGRTEEGMEADTLAEFQAVAAKHGVDWDSMCLSDNTNCPESP